MWHRYPACTPVDVAGFSWISVYSQFPYVGYMRRSILISCVCLQLRRVGPGHGVWHFDQVGFKPRVEPLAQCHTLP